MQLGPGSLPGPNFFPRGERNRRLGGVYQIESGLEGGGCRRSPQRNFSFAPLGNPIAPSSVTFGDSFPPRGSLRRCYTPATQFILARPLLPQNANPNQGTYMGTVIAPLSEQCATTAKTSECQRAGHQKRGGGGPPPRLFASGLSLEKAWIPARDRAGTHLAGYNLRQSRRDHLPTAEAPGPTWETPPGRRPPRGAAPRGVETAPTTRRVPSTPPRPRPAPGGNPRRRAPPAPVPTGLPTDDRGPPPLSQSRPNVKKP